MANTKTGIEWTDVTWNPVTGCTKVSPGCAHCYAEAITLRFKRGPAFLPGQSEINLHPERLEQPLKIKKPSRIFVNSMSDLFHEDVPDEFIDVIFAVMALAGQHAFQVLTKRPDRMYNYINGISEDFARFADILGNQQTFMYPLDAPTKLSWPVPNVWLGVSVENQYWARQRIPWLLETPAAVRFLSVEPMLKPVDLRNIVLHQGDGENEPSVILDSLTGHVKGPDDMLSKIDWVIVGGESGTKARPMQPEWVRSIRDDCVAAGVPFFFKQWGGARPGGGAILDGEEWREFPKSHQLAEA